MGVEAALVQPRFARGCRCFAVMLDGSLAGYGWLSTGPEWIGELQLEIRPRPGEGYVWNCATLPAHRRKGGFRSLLLGISAAARQGGLKRLWIGSVAIPAERAVGPSGFRPALQFDSGVVAGVHLMRVSSANLRLGIEARQVIRVGPGFYLRRSTHMTH